MADKGWLDSNTFSVDSISVSTIQATSINIDTTISFPALTSDRVVISDGAQNLISSPTTASEVAFVSGVTSSIQTQLNGKQASGNYITALTGDITASGPGSVSATLANSGVTAASYGSASEIPVITVDAKGRLTSATTVSISGTYSDEQAQDAVGNILTDTSSIDFTYSDAGNTISAVVLPAGVDHNSLANFVTNKHIDHSLVNISTGTGLTGGGDITATRTLSVVDNTTTQKVKVSKAGTLTGTRQEVNFIQGNNITITTADNGGSDRVDVTIAANSVTKSVLFEVCKYDKILNNFNLDKQASSALGNFSFVIPNDFTTLVSMHMLLVPQSGAAGTNKNIDLTSSYGGDGQSMTTHSETNTTATYNLGTTNTWTKIDLSTVFSSLAAGDRCGLEIETIGIGGEIYMLGINLVYTT
jgi:hypothetical protein